MNGGIIETSYFYGNSKPKNIIVISSQIGCPAQCTFCELGNERFVRNLSPEEMYEQVILILQQADRYSIDINAVKHKVTIANSGEPLFNKQLVEGLEKIALFGFSFKISTIFPSGTHPNFSNIAAFASAYQEPVQIQVSLISTSEEYQKKTLGIKAASFYEIRQAAYWEEKNPTGRKINLSLILTEDTPCDVNEVHQIFPPEVFRFRFRNYVPTQNGELHRLCTITQQRFEQIKKQFHDNGYEVGDWATPTQIEQRFGLAANVIRKRYLEWILSCK